MKKFQIGWEIAEAEDFDCNNIKNSHIKHPNQPILIKNYIRELYFVIYKSRFSSSNKLDFILEIYYKHTNNRFYSISSYTSSINFNAYKSIENAQKKANPYFGYGNHVTIHSVRNLPEIRQIKY